jgi:hypothetical protein
LTQKLVFEEVEKFIKKVHFYHIEQFSH